jgi:WD40 repeat protein/tRNA A-37 threonylcarbamoyl transferase component Bud32
VHIAAIPIAALDSHIPENYNYKTQDEKEKTRTRQQQIGGSFMAHSPDDRFQQLRDEILKALQAGCLVSRQDLTRKHPEFADRLHQLFEEIDVTPPVIDSDAATQFPVTAAPANSPDDLATLPPAADDASVSDAQYAATVFPTAEFAPTGVRRKGKTTEPDLTPFSAGPSGTRVRYFGDYELISEIARGGMGVVYKARQVNLNRIVALKMILSGQLASDEDIRRFHTEAESAAHLDHPGIVPIYEIGEHEGQHYFSMGFVDGKSLADRVKDGPLPPQEAANLTRKISEAIAYAHEKGVIHRDLKPANVLLDAGGEPKVTDFGLARKLEQDSGLTRTGAVMGTPSYMPPEQAAGETAQVGPLADVYSLGAILYCLITGRPPFQAANPLDTLRQVMEREPIAPTELAPSIPKDLETICLKCLQKDQLKRYESANDLAADIGRWERGEPIRARAVTRTERVYRWIKRNRIVSGLLAATAVGLVLATGFAIQARREATNARIAELQARTAEQQATESEQQARKEAANARIAELQAKTAEQKSKQAEQQARTSEATAVASQEQTEATLARSSYFLAQSRWNENRVGEAFHLLQAVPKKHRNFEWFLARRQFDQSQFSCWKHKFSANSVSYSPDGTRIASGSGDMTIKIWDASTGTELSTLNGHEHVISSVSFSPNGTRIASGSRDKSIKIWDASTGTELTTLKGHEDFVNTVSFSPNGTRIASGSDDKTIRIWDASTGAKLTTLKGHTGGVTSVNFSPDGTRIASGSSDLTIKIWDASTGTEINTLRGHIDEVSSVSFSPDGTRIASGSSDLTIKIWDASTGTELTTLKGHTGGVTSVNFSPDGTRIASGSHDGTIKIWDASTGTELTTLKGHTGTVRSVSFSPDGTRIASGSGDHTIKIWDASTGIELTTLKGHINEVSSVSFSPDGTRIASGSWDKTVIIWDASTGAELTTLKGHDGLVYSVSFSPDGTRIASGSGDHTIKIWDASTGTELITLKEHDGLVYSVSFNPDGTRIASASNRMLRIWDASTGMEITTLNGHELGLVCVSFSPDGTRIASGSWDKTIKIWDASTGTELTTLKGHTGGVTSVNFSPDGTRIASGSHDGTIKIWDASTGTELTTLKGHINEVSSVSFSPDGTRIASGGDRMIRIWDASTGTEIHTLKGHTNTVSTAIFSPDGKRIASGCHDKSVKIWDASTGVELTTLKGHTGRVRSVSFSPDSTRIASGSRDRTIKIWDASTGMELTTLKGHIREVNSVSFSSDGTRLFSEAEFGEKLFWDLRTGNVVADDHVEDIRYSGASGRSPDRRWLTVPSGYDVLLVDLNYKNTPREKLRREALARPKPRWHNEQSLAAEAAMKWYVSTFHLAWLLKMNLEDGWAYDDLHEAHLQLLATNTGQAPPLPPIVSEMLKQPRGSELPQLTDDSVGPLHTEFWNLVKTPAKVELPRVSTRHSQRMQDICSRYPQSVYLNTLGVLLYRLSQYEIAIQTLRKSLETSTGEIDPLGPNPAALAFLALCHHQLGQMEQATQFRQQLNKTVQLETWVLNPELQTILVEVQSVFDGEDSERAEGTLDDFNREAGFEGLSQHRWRFGPDAISSYPFAISATNPHSGKTCLSLQCTYASIAHQAVTVLPQSRYRLTGWIRTQDVVSGITPPNAADGVSLVIRPGDESAKWLSEINGTVPILGTTEWAQVTFEFQTGDATTMQIGCHSRFCTGTAWFDDLHLEKLE